MMKQRLLSILVSLLLPVVLMAAMTTKAPFDYVWGKAYHVLPGYTTDESGYFSICEGKDGRVYIGAAAYGRNAYLAEFDPWAERQRVAIDVNKVCGLSAKGYAAQAKIHTRNFVGPSGKIYVGSKQGYRTDPNDKSDYPGGYLMVYDPRTQRTENLGMPYPGQGIIDVVADESRRLVYIVTCEDQHWMLYDMKTKLYRELGPLLTPYACTIVDSRGRAHAITKDFRMATFDPSTGKVSVREIRVGGRRWIRAGALSIPLWVQANNGRTAFLIQLDDPTLYRVDLGERGSAWHLRDLGKMIDGKHPDSRSGLSVGADGRIYAVIRVDNATGFGTGFLHHLVRYDPQTGKNEDLGVLAVKNPDFFDWSPGPDGKPKPWTHGYHTLPDGTLTPLHAHQGLTIAADNTIYVTILYPFTLLRIEAYKMPPPRALTPADRYCTFVQEACTRIERQLPAITAVAETVAQRHLAGGLIGFPWNYQGLQQELMGRAGGMICTGFERPWKKERTDADKACDVAIISWERPPYDWELQRLQALKARGVYIVGFGPRTMPQIAEHVKLCDAFLDTGLAGGGVLTLPDGRTVGNANHLLNAINGWVFTGELVGALTRLGKMPTMWKSYAYPDGPEWGDHYLMKKQFHDEYEVPPMPAGSLGSGYLSQIRGAVEGFRRAQLDEVRRAAGLCLAEIKAARKVPVLSAGHMPGTFVGKFDDATWVQPRDFESTYGPHIRDFRENVKEGVLVVRLGYFGVSPTEQFLMTEKRLRLIDLLNEHPDPDWQLPPKAALVRIDMGCAFGDACLSLEGYPLRILPPSGVMQVVAYEAINVEVQAGLGTK